MQMSASRNPPSQPSSGHHSRSQSRLSSDMKGRAPLPVPSGPQQLQNGHSRNPSGFDMAARSPPNQSNTKHVPCKFFRQGACQAGPACPFLHSTDATIEYSPCKYFTKGNCKFGAKCALAHILPDGRRVNRHTAGGMGIGSSHLNLGGRVNPQAYVNQDSALTNSVLSQQRMNGHDPRYVSQLPSQEEFAALHPQQQPPYDTIPSIDTGLASDAGSKYGSPVEESRFPMSPNHNQYLTALDAPLPASFDSQGISHAARYGPVAASMPSRFGLESPPVQRANPPLDALRNLRDAAYGAEPKKPSSSFIGSSPPGMLEDGLGSRFLHSQRAVKPRMLSASVPRPGALDDWEDSNFPMEEDYLPMNLHDDVLTPQERLRRLSRTDHELSSSHRDLSGLGMSTSFTKVNSPLASSPSRFGALFAKQRQKKEEEAHGSLTHLGSPLRESALNFGGSPSLGPIGSPPRNTSASMISQQLSGLSLHPSSARHTPSVGTSSRLDRTVSSPVSTSKIDEEQGEGDLVFSMEEEEGNKRTSNEEHSTAGKA
ncbi:hypothetical protein BDV12DRAFT_157588 [Aspergillus spectabilis]